MDNRSDTELDCERRLQELEDAGHGESRDADVLRGHLCMMAEARYFAECDSNSDLED